MGFVWHVVLSDVLLHESSHVFELELGVTKEGWHLLEIAVQMLWNVDIDLQKYEKSIIQHSVEDGGFFGDPMMFAKDGGLTLSN